MNAVIDTEYNILHFTGDLCDQLSSLLHTEKNI